MRAERIAGVDEAGRGCLAGPVVAAAVILEEGVEIDGVADSKTLSPTRREKLAEEIRRRSRCWALGESSVEEIEQYNILQATMLAMARAVDNLAIIPDRVLIDGNRVPELLIPAQAVIGGDGSVKEISAASILAKVHRDELMCELSREHPDYGFEAHFGYATKRHLEALQMHGAVAIHRRKFSPVRKAINKLL